MYAYAKGDLFESGAQALVNPVNIVGVMGKGLALQFRKRFPDMFRAYVRACKAGEVQPGRMWIYRTDMTAGPEFVICFPTRRHWRDKSDIEDIRLVLEDLSRIITDYGIQSIAIPPLGCGNGGLKWDMVRGLMEEMLMDAPADRIAVYEPADQQSPPLVEEKNILTVQRAAILDLMFQFTELGYENTWSSVEKLAYFLQEAGIPLNIAFNKDQCGSSLRRRLMPLEGSYLRILQEGGSKRGYTVIEPLPESRGQIMDFIAGCGSFAANIRRIEELIYGFESHYGLALLAAVHLSVVHARIPQEDLNGIIANVRRWAERKEIAVTDDHIATAYKRLSEENWLHGETV